MRKATIFMAVLALVVLGCNTRTGKGEQGKKEPKPRATTQIEWITDTIHDFGVYKEREAKTYDFVYRNVGKIPFAIDSVKTSCGCTSAEYVKRAVMPGQTDTIRVVYGGNGFSPGFFYQRVVAYSNADKTILLQIRGIFDHVE